MIFDIGANRGLFTDVCLQKNSNEKTRCIHTVERK
jgi:predicted rRNA methylase YqxC with S4 and FtsJ domains